MAISRNDVVRLLALCAVEDQRTVGKEDVALWFGVAKLERWTFAAAQRVIVEHASRNADKPRLKPAAITDRLREIRKRAADSFELPRIPEEISDAEYPAWLRRQIAAHTDRLVEEWAESGAEPPPVPSLPSGPLALNAAPEHLREQLARDMARFGMTSRLPQRRARALPPVMDPDRRAEARAELDRIRPTSEEAS